MIHKISCIYSIEDPRNGEVRYIGKTANPLKRFSRHRRDALKSTTKHKNAWIKGIIQSGFEPIFNVLEGGLTTENWKEREAFWIQEFIKKGCRLLNLTKGGEGRELGFISHWRKPVYQYDLHGNLLKKWSGGIEIREHFPNMTCSGIRASCLGALRTYKKFIWLYEEDQLEVTKRVNKLNSKLK